MMAELEKIRNLLIESLNMSEADEIKEKVNDAEDLLRRTIQFYSDDGK